MSRLLVMTENYRPGGGNRWMVDVANALAPVFTETVFASNPGGIFGADLARFLGKLHVIDVPMYTVAGMREAGQSRFARLGGRLTEPQLFARTVREAHGAIDRVAPDLVVACAGGYPAARGPLAWVVAAAAVGVPAVLTVVGTPTARPGGPLGLYEAPLERRMDAQVWGAASLVVANSESILRLLERHRGMPAELGRCVHNGIEDSSHRAVHAADKPVRIGLVSRIDTEKGVFVLLDAFEQVARADADVTLTIAGSGTELERLRAEVAARGLGERVETPGFVSGDVAELVAGFDVYAMPSFQEGFPYSMIEAMRAGCAIAITDVGGVAEVLDNGADAMIVPPNDVTAMTSALERLVGDATLRAEMGAAARERYEAECTLDGMHDRLRAVFADADLLP